MRRLKRYIKKLLGKAPPPEPRVHACWGIGIYAGADPLSLGPDPRYSNPAVTREMCTDVNAGFVADPFLFRQGDVWHLYFEVLNRKNNLGEIALATSHDLARWTYQRVVLREPFHLSYPHIFAHDGEIYMIPETKMTRTVRLYRADPFPHEWTLVDTLLTGRPFADATLFQDNGRWWMFTETSQPARFDTLRLYSAPALRGTWTEHPSSPVVSNNQIIGRPSGSVVRINGKLVRFAQACTPRYGLSVSAHQIDVLSEASYAEHPVGRDPLYTGSGEGWNATRMHHVDAHQLENGEWVAAVDGAFDTTISDIRGWDR